MSPNETPGRLSLVLERVAEDVFEPEFAAVAPLAHFQAFGVDRRIFGWVRLTADRLTDLLNAHDEVEFVYAEVESLVDGSTYFADDIVVPRSELAAAIVGSPRGNPELRRHVRPHPIAVQSGEYLAGGYVHGEPGIDPIEAIRRRPPMIPLTDAWIEYWTGGERRRQWVGTVVVNRDLTDWIRAVSDDDLEFGAIRPEASSR